MNVRIFLSLILISLAIVLVFLPPNENKKDQPQPYKQLKTHSKENFEISIDQAARYVNDNDSTIQFIDLRTQEEFSAFNIPGSINIPYEQLLKKEWQGYLNQTDKTNILYTNGNLKSNLSLALLISQGYKNNKVLTGGLNQWFATVMNTRFKGGLLSARENAIFENRRKAKILFTQINSLPDSLKNTFLEVKVLEEEKLDGGCE